MKMISFIVDSNLEYFPEILWRVQRNLIECFRFDLDYYKKNGITTPTYPSITWHV